VTEIAPGKIEAVVKFSGPFVGFSNLSSSSNDFGSGDALSMDTSLDVQNLDSIKKLEGLSDVEILGASPVLGKPNPGIEVNNFFANFSDSQK